MLSMAKTKNTHAFQNDIKHYDKIRDILRYLYMYGGSTKEELVEKKLAKSISSFYDIKQRLENYIDGEFFQENKSPIKGAGKNYRFMYDPFKCPVNYLAETYQNCSYVIDDVIFYFCLMQAFVDEDIMDPYGDYKENIVDDPIQLDGSFTINDLVQQISIIYENNQKLLSRLNNITPNAVHSEQLFTVSKIRARVNELVTIGILVPVSKEYYKLSSDVFSGLSSDELSDVQLMTQFFYNCSFLTIPGFYLSSTISEYSQSNFLPETDNFFNKQENPVFFYKNNRLQSVIDDDITWALINAIHIKEAVLLTYQSKNGDLQEYNILPMKIVVEKQYGRQYFFGYNYSYDKFIMLRISAIKNISINKKMKPEQRFSFFPSQYLGQDIHYIYDKLYKENIANVWNISLGEANTLVHITFSFPQSNYGKLLNQLTSSLHHGVIKELGNGIVDFNVVTKDELELVPWIRSFGSYAIVDSQQNPVLANKIKNDWKEALTQYGTL
jgi:hypothetical protein